MPSLLEKVKKDIQADPDVTERAKKKLLTAADDFGWRAAQEMQLLYLMGRTDAVQEALTRAVQRKSETPTAA